MISVARRVALVPPAALSVLMLAGVFWPLFPHDPVFKRLIVAVGVMLVAFPLCGWTWAVYVVASCRKNRPSTFNPRRWIFILPPLIGVGGALAGLPLQNSPTAALFFLTLLIALWSAAKALEEVDGKPPISAIYETAMLMFFTPIGAWVLRPTVLRAVDLGSGQ